MIIVIILIVLAGVVYLIINSSAQSNTTTPNINLLNTTNIPIITTPLVNPIPNLLLIKGDLDLFYKLNKMSDNVDSENRTISNLTWNKDMNIIINPVDNDQNRLAVQFRFFAEFWLKKLNINNGFTNVYDLSGNIGRYDFSNNDLVYTGKFNGIEWSWDTIDYCFNTVNSKRPNKCLGGWIYNKDNGKCYPPFTSTSKCDNYEHKTIYNYTNQTDVNNWMTKCNVFNSPNCKVPREGQSPSQSSTIQPISTTSTPLSISTTSTPLSTSTTSTPLSTSQPSTSQPSTSQPSTSLPPLASKVLLADGAIILNPSNGDFKVADTLKLTPTQVSVGKGAGITQSDYAIAIGHNAGMNNQNIEAVAIGHSAGNINQGRQGIAIGRLTGQNYQGVGSIAMGEASGQTNQGHSAVAIGLNAGQNFQGIGTVAIGTWAGRGVDIPQGVNSIAIGSYAGAYKCAPNSIILSASGNGIQTTTAGLFINPIRQIARDSVSNNVLYFNEGTSEVRRG